MNTQLSRRRFVSLAAATSALAAVSGTSAIAAPSVLRSRRPNAKLGLAFIGMGTQNRYHLSVFLKNTDVRVVAVCDCDTSRREHARKMVDDAYQSQGTCFASVDYLEVLARPDVDAVVIASPDHWHAAMVIDAAKAGKDIYCEKPLSYNLAEARLMIEAVRKFNRVLQTGSQQRTEFGQVFPKAVEAVRSGRIGQLLTVHVGVPVKKTGVCPVPCDLPEEPMEPGLDWDRWLGPAPMRAYNAVLSPRGVHNNYPDWRLYREYSGGMITDFGAHHFDIAQWGIGADDSGPVQALPPLKADSMFGARLIYASGVEVLHGRPGGCLFTGSSGWIHVDRGVLKASNDHILTDPLGPKDFLIPRAESHHKDWLRAVADRKPPICDVEVGARSVAACHLVNLVYQHKRPLNWNPKTWEFENDPEANAWRDYQRREGYSLPAF